MRSIQRVLNIYPSRGTNLCPTSRFDKNSYEYDPVESVPLESHFKSINTQFYQDKNKTLINFNKKNPYFFDRSINPYRGCEHGCVYCYARPSHNYLGLSAGLDFESKIFFKTNVKEQLKKELSAPGYTCKPVVLGSNTDPYQPLERRLNITRSILEILLDFKHPVRILTRSALILRDLDILKTMASSRLVHVGISVTTVNEKLARLMEPRTMTIEHRLKTIHSLSNANIPTTLMVAPVIPLINEHEIEAILMAGHQRGASHAFYSWVRLEPPLPEIFFNWVKSKIPERSKRVIKTLKDLLNQDPGYECRKKLFADRFNQTCKRLGIQQTSIELDCEKFISLKSKQLSFF